MSSPPLRVAILQNFLISEVGGHHMIANITKLVRQSKPSTEVNVYAPIQGDKFPNLHDHDLVILTGGPFNLLEDDKPLWVTDTLDYIKTATTDRATPKLVGLCWGQQAIVLALGGTLRKREHCVGIETLSLTPTGTAFFNAKSVDIHKNHAIEVVDIGARFSCLAPNNEILLSKDNQVLTFQGHPEMDSILANLFVATEDPASGVQPGLKPLDAPHDGEKIFAAIMDWAAGGKMPQAVSHVITT